jgi:hypothetical protein
MSTQARLPSESRINADRRRPQPAHSPGHSGGRQCLCAPAIPGWRKTRTPSAWPSSGSALSGILGSAWAYYTGARLRGTSPSPLAAFCMSLLHELEHDLIHMMYFRKNKFWNDFMLGRRLAIPPQHHQPMGAPPTAHSPPQSVGHRKLTWKSAASPMAKNGECKRLLMTGDNLLAVYLRPLHHLQNDPCLCARSFQETKQEARAIARENTLMGYFPAGRHQLHAVARFCGVPRGALFVAGLLGMEIAVPALVQRHHAMA